MQISYNSFCSLNKNEQREYIKKNTSGWRWNNNFIEQISFLLGELEYVNIYNYSQIQKLTSSSQNLLDKILTNNPTEEEEEIKDIIFNLTEEQQDLLSEQLEKRNLDNLNFSDYSSLLDVVVSPDDISLIMKCYKDDEDDYYGLQFPKSSSEDLHFPRKEFLEILDIL